jgi:ABC-type uncharacterized transport system permease subunit
MRLAIEKRESRSKLMLVLVPVLSFLISLLLAGLLLLVSRANPLETYAAMFHGAFGGTANFTETLVKAIPLMLTGLGVLIAFRMEFWNIGAEGQLTLGGVATAWVALYWSPGLPGWLVLPAALLMGMLAGAFWAGVPAALNAYMNVNETLTTLMLNYVAILLAEHLYYGPWRDPKGYGFPGTAPLPEVAWLPRIAGRAHLGIVFAILLALFIWFAMNRTKWGFEVNILGKNRTAARFLGIRIERMIVVSLLVSGMLSGLAGAGEVTGISRRLQQGLSIGYGYTAIIVAWLSQLNAIAVIFVAVLIAALSVGGDQVQMVMGLPSAMGLVLQGMLLLPMLAGALFTDYRLVLVGPPARDGKAVRKEAPQ